MACFEIPDASKHVYFFCLLFNCLLKKIEKGMSADDKSINARYLRAILATILLASRILLLFDSSKGS